MSEVKLNWSSAQVQDGELTVELEGDPSDAWQQAFATTSRQLRGSGWDEPEVEDGSIRVGGLAPGVEDKLRHHLEGLVQQANETERRAQEAQGEEDDGEDGKSEDGKSEDDNGDGEAGEREDDEEESESERETPDDEMAERFRGFGGSSSEGSEGDGNGSEED